MHQFFVPLNDREAMLLLTTLTVGGSDQTSLFNLLPAESAQRLQEKAQRLLEISSNKRVPFMVKEMKQALSFKGLRGVEKVDPSWILQAMKGESPRTVAAILVSLPSPMVRSVLKRLPRGIRKNLPPKEEFEKVPVELVRAVRQIFESRFHVMPPAPGRLFCFRDLINLERKELYALMRDLGLVELGQAFLAVGKLPLAELCRRLPRAKAEELIHAVRRASMIDAPNLKMAQRFLSRVVVNFDNTEEFFQKAGLWRIAKACMGQGDDFHAVFRQRLPRDAGELFYQFLEKAAEMEELSEDILDRLRDAILSRVKALGAQNIISSHWAQIEIAFNDPTFEQRATAVEQGAAGEEDDNASIEAPPAEIPSGEK